MAKQFTGPSSEEDNDWQLWSEARIEVFETLFGTADDQVYHAAVPMSLGGNADVLHFQPPGMGVTYVTSDLIGDSGQPETELGNYELMICCRGDETWAPNLLSQLAVYSLEHPLNPWETMSIGSALPKESTLSSLAFVPYSTFKVRGRDCGLLLCLGLTEDELEAFHETGHGFIIDRLKAKKVYPYSDVQRKSVLDF